MKKTLVLALSLATAPLFAGEAPVITVPTPPPACCPLSVEVAAGYAMAMDDIYDGLPSKDIDLYTIDVTGVYNINEKHAVTLRCGYGFGDECERMGSSDGNYRHETDVHTFVFMPGYRYTHAINEKWSAYIGANIGIANVSVKDCEDWSNGDNGERMKAHDSAWGLAYSVEIGTSYKIDADWHVFATYGIYGSTATPDVTYMDEYSIRANHQNYHGIRIGVGYKF